MSEWNAENWKDTLILVYERATRDPAYRTLCETDPLAAVQAVSDIEVPEDAKTKFRFFGDSKSMVYSYLLPPVGDTSDVTDEQVRQLLSWDVKCTGVPTANY